jgi:hypothetical protein
MVASLMPFEGIENPKLDLNPAPMCFCPNSDYSCPLQLGPEQEQSHYCLPPATLQFKALAEMPRSDPVLGDWNLEDFSIDTGLRTDKIKLI